MKHLRFVLIVLMLQGLCTAINAQGIERVKVLFFQFTSSQEFPMVFSDSVIITHVSNDTTWFNTTANNPTGKGFYYRAGSKVYRMFPSLGDVLYYDYSLVKNDTFFNFSGQQPDTFIVDSVYYRKMNHRTFKAWHLTSTSPVSGSIVKWEWLEGLGEFHAGWDTKFYIFTDAGWEIKGMCLNDSVIYWNTDFNYFKDRNPSPTCALDSVSLKLSVSEPLYKNIFNIYPNPSSGILTMEAPVKGTLTLMDGTGKICLPQISFETGLNSIDLTGLKTGVYLMRLFTGQENLYKRICIAAP